MTRGRNHPLVDVDLLPRTTDSEYHPDAPSCGSSELFTGAPRWVPYEMVHTAYTLPEPDRNRTFDRHVQRPGFRGNHLLEAISHAICEIVERDAATLHAVRALEDAASRRIDPWTVDDPGCGEALDRIDLGALHVGDDLGHDLRHRHSRLHMPDSRAAPAPGRHGL